MVDHCCGPDTRIEKHEGFDFILYGSSAIILLAIALELAGAGGPHINTFAHTTIEFLSTMWWGIVLGIIFVGLMTKVPKEYFNVVLGKGDSLNGILRATVAGLFLDMCSHGILLVGAKLYERGASLAQVMAFMIASPWNSLSLTIILIALIGLKWTLIYVAGSALIAIITGLIYIKLIKHGYLPSNPNTTKTPEHFDLVGDVKARLKGFKFTSQFLRDITLGSLAEARMLLRWLLLGVVIASLIRTFVPPDFFSDWFGPTLIGLGLTLVATTIIEVCSEGSAPIASEIFNRAGAPGNAFAFLMAGVSTDYTEIMIIREFAKSWAIALSLPLVTVPQILLLGYIMNIAQ